MKKKKKNYLSLLILQQDFSPFENSFEVISLNLTPTETETLSFSIITIFEHFKVNAEVL